MNWNGSITYIGSITYMYELKQVHFIVWKNISFWTKDTLGWCEWGGGKWCESVQQGEEGWIWFPSKINDHIFKIQHFKLNPCCQDSVYQYVGPTYVHTNKLNPDSKGSVWNVVSWRWTLLALVYQSELSNAKVLTSVRMLAHDIKMMMIIIIIPWSRSRSSSLSSPSSSWPAW